FTVHLTNVSGATIGDDTGIGTILNDDTTAIAFSVIDFAMPEGDSGHTPFTFTVDLSNASDSPVSVQFDTADGTATAADGDYVPVQNLVLTFNPGDPLTQTVTVNVRGDTEVERNESFLVNLSNATGVNVSIATPTATATALNDDTTELSISDF